MSVVLVAAEEVRAYRHSRRSNTRYYCTLAYWYIRDPTDIRSDR